MRNRPRIALGTVQFGTSYGISNRDGMTPAGEVSRILRLAGSLGMRTIDTATAYGRSEEVLGCSWPAGHAFEVVTKTPPIPGAHVETQDVQRLVEAFERSLERLRLPAVYGLLAHHGPDLLKPGGDALWRAMDELRARGLVGRIGVSVYRPADAMALIDRYDISLIQLPCNVLDQRFLRSGLLARMQAADIEIHARSIFLQGLLLMPAEELPGNFRPLAPLLDEFRAFAKAEYGSAIRACLSFALAVPGIARCVLGVVNEAQLQEIAAAADGLSDAADFERFAIDEEAFLDPSRWPVPAG